MPKTGYVYVIMIISGLYNIMYSWMQKDILYNENYLHITHGYGESKKQKQK
jgi:hypothetical protein